MYGLLVVKDMNKLAVIIPFFKRHEITNLCFKNIYRQDIKYCIDVYCIGSEGDLSKDLAENYGFKYLEASNNPVSKKFDLGLQQLKGKGYDGVMIIGSDNFISDSVIEHYLQVDCSINAIYGFSDLHTYSTHENKLGTKGAYNFTGMTVGVARMFTKVLLEKANYSLWRRDLNSGLDGSSNGVIQSLGAKEFKINYDSKYFILDVKHELNITSHAILKTCKEIINPNLIKKHCETIYEELINLKTINIQPTIKRQRIMKNTKRATVIIEITKDIAGMKKGETKNVSKVIAESGQIAGWCKILPLIPVIEEKVIEAPKKVLISDNTPKETTKKGKQK